MNQGNLFLPLATSTGQQCSSRMTSMIANGILVLPTSNELKRRVLKGEILDAIVIGSLFDWFGLKWWIYFYKVY